MMKKLIAVLLLFVMTISCSIQAFAFTPRYSVSMPKIPDIHVELSDATKKAVDNAVKEQLEKTDGSSGDATVRVRAHGENDTCSLWSEVVYICCNAYY